MTHRIFTLVALLSMLSCSTDPETQSRDLKNFSGDRGTIHALENTDGIYVTTAAGEVLNSYAVLGADVTAGSASLTVTDITDLNSATFGSLAVGDLLMIVQMQGATIDVASNTAAYGTVTAINNAGKYELINIAGISGNTLTVDATCNGGTGLKNSYTAAGHTQVIRVPQLTTLTVTAGTSITAPAWDGSVGGVVALQVSGTTTIDGSVDVSAKGFRGGAADNTSSFTACVGNNCTPADPVDFRTVDINLGAEKGEGIAGYQTDYDANGRYGRGAAANGGGGGSNHNSGGGGGANGNSGQVWTGQGVMDGTVTGAAAWNLDPGFIANGNALTTSSGGGRGGYSFSNTVLNPTAAGPGPANGWTGSGRREIGGRGGHPVDNDPTDRLFMGGGGGAGDSNLNLNPGGHGAGIVFLISGTVTGVGQISANGANGENNPNPVTPFLDDGPSGAGAGGTVILQSSALSGITINAKGGTGGMQQYTVPSDRSMGPGGGGGGGYVATSGGAVTIDATGGSGGNSNATNITQFPRNGATNGAAGATVAVTTLPICLTPAGGGAGINPTLTDNDGDGVTNTEETAAGLNPNDSSDVRIQGSGTIGFFGCGAIGGEGSAFWMILFLALTTFFASRRRRV